MRVLSPVLTALLRALRALLCRSRFSVLLLLGIFQLDRCIEIFSSRVISLLSPNLSIHNPALNAGSSSNRDGNRQIPALSSTGQ